MNSLVYLGLGIALISLIGALVISNYFEDNFMNLIKILACGFFRAC